MLIPEVLGSTDFGVCSYIAIEICSVAECESVSVVCYVGIHCVFIISVEPVVVVDVEGFFKFLEESSWDLASLQKGSVFI